MSSKVDVGNVLGMLATAFPRFTLTKEINEVYFRLLNDIPVDELRAAALNCATSKDFFPSVHELRAEVMKLRGKVTGLPTAYEAWENTCKARAGYWLMSGGEQKWIEPEWSHPIVEHVARQLGWPGSFPSDNPAADRAHYFKAYEHAVNIFVDEEMMLPEVRGYIEQSKQKQLEAGNGRRGKTETVADVQRRLPEGD